METELKKLPIGIQTFEKIREENYIYADKTRFLVNMIDNGEIYFFARPRRFGKSLTVSTLEAMFSGRKELFGGLYAEEFMNRADYRASPVILLDMGKTVTGHGIEVMERTISKLTLAQAERHGVEIDGNMSCGEILDKSISEVYKRQGKVAVLIDEYDKPYTDFYNKPEMAESVRNALRDYYGCLKANDKYIRFIFITGIAKFAQFSLFSVLNHPNDISVDRGYGEMCGLTEAEIMRYFSGHIAETAGEMGISSGELLEKMRAYYDGFCFDAVHRLYNPFSTLNFFSKREFLDFWMQSGASRLMGDYMKTRSLTVEQFRNVLVPGKFVNNPGEIESVPPEGFLYQTGYLTIRKKAGNDFILDYPNTEVLNSMSELLARNILSGDNSFGSLRTRLLFSLAKNRIDDLQTALNALLASVPYDDFTGAGELNIMENDYTFPVQEWLYRSSILTFLRGCGIVVFAEMHTNLGRADLVVSHRDKTYVIELKVAYRTKDVPAKLAEAVGQMKRKNYLAPYPGATGLALVIDNTKRQITKTDVVR